MRVSARIKSTLQFVAFAFYPKTTLIACAVFSAVVMSALGVVMAVIPQDSIWYDLVFALTTGAAGSFFVSFIVELTGNYRHNKLAWQELQNYYAAVMHYETYKQIKMQMTPHQRAEKKAYEEFVAAGGIDERNEDEKPKDRIQITWEQLPDIIPVFRRTFEEKKEFLNDAEIWELERILSEYEEIQHVIRERILMSPMIYDALNHPDETYLESSYPLDVIKNMPDWVRKHLASMESQKACEKYADAILSDMFLLLQFMKNYEVSEKGLAWHYDVEDSLNEESAETENIDYEKLDFEEADDEESFRAQNEEFDKQMEVQQRPFVSWRLSSCCKNISESMDILEKSILKKPYYGMMIKFSRDSARQPLDDDMSVLSYEYEKIRLDEILYSTDRRNSSDLAGEGFDNDSGVPKR